MIVLRSLAQLVVLALIAIGLLHLYAFVQTGLFPL